MLEVFHWQTGGANRHSDDTVIEQMFSLDAGESAALAAMGAQALLQRIAASLNANAIPLGVPAAQPGPYMATLAHVYAWLCLNLQRAAGHAVGFMAVFPRENPAEFHCVFEFEHEDIGLGAERIAWALITAAIPEIKTPPRVKLSATSLRSGWLELRQKARETRLPADTAAVIQAARKLRIPYVKLEREPFEAVSVGSRLRPNSLLALGDCGNRQVLDGMLCLERSGHLGRYVLDRKTLRDLAVKHAFPVPESADSRQAIRSYENALAAAGSLGYPLVVKARMRTHGRLVFAGINSAAELERACQKVLNKCPEILLERHVPGNVYRVLATPGNLIGTFDAEGRRVIDKEHPSIVGLAEQVVQEERAGLLALTIVADSIKEPLATTKGFVVDVDFAPRLDRLMEPDSRYLAAAATKFLRWLYPADVPTGVPRIAVSGSSSKSVTARAIARLLQAQGLNTALVDNEGYHFEGRLAEPWESAGELVYHLPFEEASVQAVVQEYPLGRIARRGFAWQHCEVAVLTGVDPTQATRPGVETPEALQELALALPRRAHKVVLNGDDPHSLALLSALESHETWLCSAGAGRELEAKLPPERCRLCVVRPQKDREWVVLVVAGKVTPIAPLTAIGVLLPASRSDSASTAAHGVQPALLALTAALCAGTDVSALAHALAALETAAHKR